MKEERGKVLKAWNTQGNNREYWEMHNKYQAKIGTRIFNQRSPEEEQQHIKNLKKKMKTYIYEQYKKKNN